MLQSSATLGGGGGGGYGGVSEEARSIAPFHATKLPLLGTPRGRTRFGVHIPRSNAPGPFPITAYLGKPPAEETITKGPSLSISFSVWPPFGFDGDARSRRRTGQVKLYTPSQNPKQRQPELSTAARAHTQPWIEGCTRYAYFTMHEKGGGGAKERAGSSATRLSGRISATLPTTGCLSLVFLSHLPSPCDD